LQSALPPFFPAVSEAAVRETRRRRIRFNSVAVAGLALAVAPLSLPANADDSLSVNASQSFQTVGGWVGVVGNDPLLSSFQTSETINLAVNQLGLTSLRLDMPLSVGETNGQFQPTLSGINPSNSNWSTFDTTANSGMNTVALDSIATSLLQPFQQAVASANPSNASAFTLTTNPSWYNGGGTGTLPQWMQNNPGAYAEVLVSLDEYLTHKYGITPTFSTIMNEAGNANNMTPALEAQVITAMGPMLKAAGLSTAIDLGSGENAQAAEQYATNSAMTSTVYQYVGAIDYHDYSDTNAASDKAALAATASANNVATMENEGQFSGNAFDNMFQDLTVANVSYWGQYYLSGYSAGGGIQYFNAGLDGASFSAPPQQMWTEREVMYYVRPGAIRIGTTASNTGLETMAFAQSGGPYAGTTVVIGNATASAATEDVSGLAPGQQYGISYALGGASPSQSLTELGIHTANDSGGLNVSVPAGSAGTANTVLTIYPYHGNDTPEIFTDAASGMSSSQHYLLTSSGITTSTLTVSATSPELSTLSYDWTLASEPNGASVSFQNGAATAASVTAQGLSLPGQYTFNIAVSDTSSSGKAFTANDQVAIDVFNGYPAPVVQNVESRSINSGNSSNQPLTLVQGQQSSVRLVNQVFLSLYDSTLTSSNVKDTVTWTQISGPATAALTNDETSNGGAGYVLANGLTASGTYVFQMNATDSGNYAAAPQQVSVVVLPANTGTLSVTSASGSETSPGHGSLAGVVADNGNYGNDVVNWWQVLSQPSGSHVTFSNEASPNSTFSVDVPGTYTFQLDAVDETEFASSPASGGSVVTVTIDSVPEPALVASLVPFLAMLMCRASGRGPRTERENCI
jgi:hypothetical protein